MTKEKTKRRKNQEEGKRDGFVFLPRWLFEANFLSGKDKLFCLTLAYHRNQHTKLCCPKVPTICSETHFSKPTILKIRAKLKKLGLINCEAGLGGKSYARYKLNWLDNSKQEIERLKEILKTKELVKKRTSRTGKEEKHSTGKEQKSLLVKKRTSRTGKKENLATGKKENLLLVKKRTTNNKELNNKKENNNKAKKPVVVSSFSQEDKPKNQNLPQELINRIVPFFNDKGWKEFQQKDIEKQIKFVFEFEETRLSDYFRYWKKHIDKMKGIRGKPGLLIAMITERKYPPGFFDDEEEPHPPYLDPFKDEKEIL